MSQMICSTAPRRRVTAVFRRRPTCCCPRRLGRRLSRTAGTGQRALCLLPLRRDLHGHRRRRVPTFGLSSVLDLTWSSSRSRSALRRTSVVPCMGVLPGVVCPPAGAFRKALPLVSARVVQRVRRAVFPSRGLAVPSSVNISRVRARKAWWGSRATTRPTTSARPRAEGVVAGTRWYIFWYEIDGFPQS